MDHIIYQVHWLSFTIHAELQQSYLIYEILFRNLFGELEKQPHGARGFKDLYIGLMGFKLYAVPINSEYEYFHYEIPGQACELIDWAYFKGLWDLMTANYPGKIKITRLDLAFDHSYFTPMDVYEAFKDGNVRTLAKRETVNRTESPFQLKDNGEEGTETVNIGSRTSERMIRVYNKRGTTRLEFETHDTRATQIAYDLFQYDYGYDIFPILIGHLRDYIDFKYAWWEQFTSGLSRAYKVVSTPREITKDKMLSWYLNQLTPAVSTIRDFLGEKHFEETLDRGRKFRKNKYISLLEVDHD